MIHIIFFQNYEQQTLQHAFTEATICNCTPPFSWLEESNGIWAIQLRWGLIPTKTYLGALMTRIKYRSIDWYTSKPTGVLTYTHTYRHKHTLNPGEVDDSPTKASFLRILCVYKSYNQRTNCNPQRHNWCRDWVEITHIYSQLEPHLGCCRCHKLMLRAMCPHRPS